MTFSRSIKEGNRQVPSGRDSKCCCSYWYPWNLWLSADQHSMASRVAVAKPAGCFGGNFPGRALAGAGNGPDPSLLHPLSTHQLSWGNPAGMTHSRYPSCCSRVSPCLASIGQSTQNGLGLRHPLKWQVSRSTGSTPNCALNSSLFDLVMENTFSTNVWTGHLNTSRRSLKMLGFSKNKRLRGPQRPSLSANRAERSWHGLPPPTWIKPTSVPIHLANASSVSLLIWVISPNSMTPGHRRLTSFLHSLSASLEGHNPALQAAKSAH